MPNQQGIPTLQDLLGQAAAINKQNNDQQFEMQKQEQEHALKEQGAQNRLKSILEVSSAHPGYNFGLSTEGASISKPQSLIDLSPGQKAVDTNFGKDYADYQAGGGKAGLEKNLSSVEEAANKIGSLDAYDRAAGILPKTLRELVAPKQASVEDAIKGAVQTTLKQTLGSQFTEREGQAAMDRAYNPRLSNEENLARAKKIIKELEGTAKSKQDAAQYFEKRGTLQGYTPSQKTSLKPQPSNTPPQSTFNPDAYLKGRR